MSNVPRLAVRSTALATSGYSLWLLLVGIPVGMADITGVRWTERAPVPAAIVPLLLSVLVVAGLRRGSTPMAWVGAAGVLVYGLLAVFGMGLYVVFLGLLLVMTMAWYSMALHRADRR